LIILDRATNYGASIYTLRPRKNYNLDNVRQKCQIWTHPNQIACAWLQIYLQQNCQIS